MQLFTFLTVWQKFYYILIKGVIYGTIVSNSITISSVKSNQNGYSKNDRWYCYWIADNFFIDYTFYHNIFKIVSDSKAAVFLNLFNLYKVHGRPHALVIRAPAIWTCTSML
jgi:hypothetical protein